MVRGCVQALEWPVVWKHKAMHSKQASGKLTAPPIFQDAEKAVDLIIQVVDPVDVKKCKTGVYTGMSIGGSYVGTPWMDPNNPRLKRYTGNPSEFSLVDNPAVPTATFQMVKSDGTQELRKFAMPVVLDVEAEEPRAHDNPQGLTDMQIEEQPDGP